MPSKPEAVAESKGGAAPPSQAVAPPPDASRNAEEPNVHDSDAIADQTEPDIFDLADPVSASEALEELPPDFWDDEPLAPREQPVTPQQASPPGKIDADAPLFEQLQHLFPGRVVRREKRASEVQDGLEEENATQDSLFD